ncbi:MAG: DJ-1/PfpI family protein [Bacteroidales bacterium]|nr:DJ-1/PfpI family protein [Bacteroidales bacterium]MDD3906785.1 DJ-1/PfpI family protein [Bacteroidales bacterium]MDD4712088.1 DJ-1/PfpI family protein [Bacteroidales bacterium]
MKQLFLFLAPGFEEIEAITIIDILRRAGLNVSSVSITGDLHVVGAHGIAIEADCLYPEIDFDEAAMLILPGGQPGTKNLNVHEGLKAALSNFAKAGKPLAAICAAPMILGQLGILEGKEATCYPGNEVHLKGATLSKKRVVRDGSVITAAGPGLAIKFALEIVNFFLGEEKAEEISKDLLLK